MTNVLSNIEDALKKIQSRLRNLEQQRLQLKQRLRLLESATTQPIVCAPAGAEISDNSPVTDKIAVFRRLFGGRADVFPARLENPNTG